VIVDLDGKVAQGYVVVPDIQSIKCAKGRPPKPETGFGPGAVNHRSLMGNESTPALVDMRVFDKERAGRYLNRMIEPRGGTESPRKCRSVVGNAIADASVIGQADTRLVSILGHAGNRKEARESESRGGPGDKLASRKSESSLFHPVHL